MTSDDYAPGVAIYPNGRTRKGTSKRAAITDVPGALGLLRRDLAACVATEAEAAAVLTQWRAEREGRPCRPNG